LFGHAEKCSYPGRITMGDETMLSAVVPARANGGSETRFGTDNQPEGRGRPRGSPNKMSPAFKQMLLEVAKELGSVPYKDWDKLPCGDGLKGFLKTLAIQDLKAFAMLMCRALPPPPPFQEE
jgi:hypothetical protein